MVRRHPALVHPEPRRRDRRAARAARASGTPRPASSRPRARRARRPAPATASAIARPTSSAPRAACSSRSFATRSSRRAHRASSPGPGCPGGAGERGLAVDRVAPPWRRSPCAAPTPRRGSRAGARAPTIARPRGVQRTARSPRLALAGAEERAAVDRGDEPDRRRSRRGRGRPRGACRTAISTGIPPASTARSALSKRQPSRDASQPRRSAAGSRSDRRARARSRRGRSRARRPGASSKKRATRSRQEKVRTKARSASGAARLARDARRRGRRWCAPSRRSPGRRCATSASTSDAGAPLPTSTIVGHLGERERGEHDGRARRGHRAEVRARCGRSRRRRRPPCGRRRSRRARRPRARGGRRSSSGRPGPRGSRARSRSAARMCGTSAVALTATKFIVDARTLAAPLSSAVAAQNAESCASTCATASLTAPVRGSRPPPRVARLEQRVGLRGPQLPAS